MTEVDQAVAEYRERLTAKARMADSDLDELEDHMRQLIDDLRTRGVPAAAAIKQAAERLGDPHDLAREHMRARSAFGAPLSPARALCAAVLFGVPVVVWCIHFARVPNLSLRSWAESLAWMFLVVSLVARTSWSRHLVMGLVAHRLAFGLLMPITVHPLNVLLDLATLALIVPWRRSEHSWAGVGLALRAWMMFAAGTMAISAHSVATDGALVTGATTVALVLSITSCVGTIRGARYDAISTVTSAFVLLAAIGSVLVMPLELEDAAAWRACAVGIGATGIVAGALSLLRGRPDRRPPAGDMLGYV